MIAETPILKKVTLEWSDGDIMTLEGEAAEEWDRACRAENSFAYARGWRFPQLDWKHTSALKESAE